MSEYRTRKGLPEKAKGSLQIQSNIPLQFNIKGHSALGIRHEIKGFDGETYILTEAGFAGKINRPGRRKFLWNEQKIIETVMAPEYHRTSPKDPNRVLCYRKYDIWVISADGAEKVSGAPYLQVVVDRQSKLVVSFHQMQEDRFQKMKV